MPQLLKKIEKGDSANQQKIVFFIFLGGAYTKQDKLTLYKFQ